MGPLSVLRMTDDQIWNTGGMITDSGKRKYWLRNPVKMPFCAPQIPHILDLTVLRSLFIGWATLSFWLRVKRQNLSLLLSRRHVMT